MKLWVITVGLGSEGSPLGLAEFMFLWSAGTVAQYALSSSRILVWTHALEAEQVYVQHKGKSGASQISAFTYLYYHLWKHSINQVMHIANPDYGKSVSR